MATVHRISAHILAFLAMVTVCLLLRQSSYLLFHAVVEGFAIVVASSLFVVAWNSRRISSESWLVLLGVGFGNVALLDFLHTLAYQGMGVFPAAREANLATQLWVVARYVQAGTLVLAPLVSGRRLAPAAVMAGYGVVTGLILATIFLWRDFPVCFDPVTGLTTFKNVSEYVICLLLVLAALLIFGRREKLPIDARWLLLSALAATAVSEFMFTLYAGPFAWANFTGHVLKVVAFYLIYRAIVTIALMRPYEILFHDLRENQVRLEAEKIELERALGEIRTLRGILPICASCKKVRDDSGYWRQVEEYVQSHSDATFSHGLCPDCFAEALREDSART